MTPNSRIRLESGAVFANDAPLALIAGPCQLESRQHAFDMAGALKELTAGLGLGFVYKTSFDKANRTALTSTRGVGLDAALPIFADLRKELGIALLTDVHTAEHGYQEVYVPFIANADSLFGTGQLPKFADDQFRLEGEFGYNTLVSDMRALPIMAETGAPVIFDATHSVQQPGGQGATSGGERRFVATLARAAVAVGVAGVFIETHQDPDNSTSSDGPNMVPLKDMPALIEQLMAFDRIAKG